jgi:hypothetical protein
MKRLPTFTFLAALLLAVTATFASAEDSADVIVYGSSPGEFSLACSAASGASSRAVRVGGRTEAQRR